MQEFFGLPAGRPAHHVPEGEDPDVPAVSAGLDADLRDDPGAVLGAADDGEGAVGVAAANDRPCEDDPAFMIGSRPPVYGLGSPTTCLSREKRPSWSNGSELAQTRDTMSHHSCASA
jgi:hypothetical protein